MLTHHDKAIMIRARDLLTKPTRAGRKPISLWTALCRANDDLIVPTPLHDVLFSLITQRPLYTLVNGCLTHHSFRLIHVDRAVELAALDQLISR